MIPGAARTRWIDRSWSFTAEPPEFPALVNKLAVTPRTAATLVRGVSETVLRRRPHGGWSAIEHIAHLGDLADLDDTRLQEFLRGADSRNVPPASQ